MTPMPLADIREVWCVASGFDDLILFRVKGVNRTDVISSALGPFGYREHLSNLPGLRQEPLSQARMGEFLQCFLFWGPWDPASPEGQQQQAHEGELTRQWWSGYTDEYQELWAQLRAEGWVLDDPRPPMGIFSVEGLMPDGREFSFVCTTGACTLEVGMGARSDAGLRDGAPDAACAEIETSGLPTAHETAARLRAVVKHLTTRNHRTPCDRLTD